MYAHAILLAVIIALLPLESMAERIITIGRPTNEVRLEYRRLQPIAAYLADRLSGRGVTEGEVVLDAKNSVAATVELIRAGKIDLIFETPFSSLQFIDRAGARPIMQIRREGVLQYGSVVFVRNDSGITSINDLIGKVIAFEDAGSTSAYHIPRSALEANGLQLAPLADPESSVPPGKVGYVFAGSELNVSSWVHYGRTQAGALSDLDWHSQNENPAAFREHFRIILETWEVPRMLVLSRSGLEPELIDGAIDVLSAMHETEQGREALSHYKIDAFVPIEDGPEFVEELRKKLYHRGEFSQ